MGGQTKLPLRFRLLGVLLGAFSLCAIGLVHAHPAKAAQYNVVDPGQGRLQYYFGNSTASDGTGPPGYVPEQFLVISRTPDYAFELSAVCNANANCGRPEITVSQLTNFNSGYQGAPLDLGTINLNSNGWFGNFNLGQADPNRIFSDGNYPQYNGFYVFLLKVHDKDDPAPGYITGIQGLYEVNETTFDYNETGCAKPFQPWEISCPDVVKDFSGASFIDSTNFNLGTNAPHMIASAPSNISFGFAGNDNPRRYRNEALRVLGAGSYCRDDFKRAGALTYGWPGASVPYITNGDWDNALIEGGDEQMQAWINGQRAYNGDPTYTTISGHFWDGVRSINLYQPDSRFAEGSANPPAWAPFGAADGWWVDQASSRNLDLTNVGSANLLWMGGATFTTGPWPGCTNPISVVGFTPGKTAWSNGQLYNGHDAFTQYGNIIDSRLHYSFGYYIPSTSNVPNNSALTCVLIDGASWRGCKYRTYAEGVATNGWTWESPEIQSGDLAGGWHNWVACAWSGSAGACDQTPHWYYVNKGPDTYSGAGLTLNNNPPTPPNGGASNYKCDFLFNGVIDPEGASFTQTKFNVTWVQPNGQVFSTYTNIDSAPIRKGPVSFTSDEVREITTGKTLTSYLRDNIPEGSNVFWNSRSRDFLGAADMDDATRAFSAAIGDVVDAANNNWLGTSPQFSQGNTGWKWGLLSATNVYHKNTRPNFQKPEAKKEFFDINNNPLPNSTATDGQTVQVRTTLTNTGETPMKYYKVVDYLGSVRDFEKPDPRNVSVGFTQNGGGRASVGTLPDANGQPDGPYPVVSNDHNSVINGKDSNGNDKDIPASDGDNSQDRGSAWKFDFGDNQTNGSALNRAGAPTELAPKQSMIINYVVRADRNRTAVTSNGTTDTGGTATTKDENDQGKGGNYNGRYNVGRNGAGDTINFSDAHTYTNYQEYYCDNTQRKQNTIELPPGDVLSPFVRGSRGSIGSNSNIQGYDGNATYTITASGQVQHFTGANTIGNYNGQNPCESDPTRKNGIDWRKEMMTNLAHLQTGPKQTNLNPLLVSNGVPRGNLDGKVYYAPGGLTIGDDPNLPNDPSKAVIFKGNGTIVVKGDLTINANTYYANDASPEAKNAGNATTDTSQLHSLGIIVMGNLKISANVTHLVGSYYVSDVETDANGLPVLNPNGCPKFPTTGKTPGDVNTAADASPTRLANQQLKVDGLIIARYFDFPRFYTNPTPGSNSPAENVYYDGRVVAATPPGFALFRTTNWYEIAP